MANWHTVKSVADHCMVSKITVRRWIKAGKLLAIKLPSGHYRIRLTDFEDFLGKYHMMPGEDSYESKSIKKGGKSYGSTDIDGVFGTG